VIGHVVDEIADYLEGRLAPHRLAEVEEHLGTCADCAADFAFGRELRDEAARQGLRHLAAERFVELGSTAAPTPTDAEAQHLDRCEMCRAELSWMRGLPAEEEARRARVVPLFRRRAAWLLLAAAIAGLALWPRGGGRDLSRFARLEPIPVRLTRGDANDSFERERLLGLERYSNADWAGARESLSAALRARPASEEIRLYLGSAELLDGDVDAAVGRLRGLVDEAADPGIRAEARWQLANALLAAKQTQEEAMKLLEAVAAAPGRRAGPARELLGRIRSGD
jgi:hypothetical protein